MKGRLWLVVGPSGAGKDTLLRQLAHEPCGERQVRIARRWITRPAHDSETHHAIDDRQFDAMLAARAFALHWRANGVRYGVGREIDDWLAEGCAVLLNGSREHLGEALARYPLARVVHVQADPDRIAARLAARGREDGSAIDARLARNASLAESTGLAGPHVATIDNDADPGEAARLLRALIAER